MRKEFVRFWWCIPAVMILLILVYFICTKQTALFKDEDNILSFHVVSGNHAETIDAWYDDGTYYAFLPSYAQMNQVSAAVNTSYSIDVEGTALTSETDLSQFVIGKEYTIRISRGKRFKEEKLCFLRSANVATMYIHTSAGGIERIHKDKNHKESVQVVLINENGENTYAGAQDTLKGRGNSSWRQDKKPYLLSLSKEASMLGMDASDKWVLLANAMDPSGLKTKIIFDFASKIGLKATPKCEYVDLYLNGKYAGLYLICEKVENVYLRQNISTDSFLCALEERKGEYSTQESQSFVIAYPQNPTTSQKEAIVEFVQTLETEIKTGDHLSEMLDMDSWVRRYLIEELFENLDASRSSSYFYYSKEGGNGKFYAGPLWDMDLSWGDHLRLNNPKTLFANEEWRSPIQRHPWYYWLLQNSAFHQSAENIFNSEILNRIDSELIPEIDRQALRIESAERNNDIRWHQSQKDVDELKTYLTERTEFLTSVLVENEPYFFVQVVDPESGEYLNYSIKPGDTLPALPDELSSQFDTLIWIDRDTGEAFDYGQPITKDTVLIIQTTTPTNKVALFTLACVGMMGTILLAFIWIDRKRNRTKR